jgi:hypothetical protein
MTFEKVLNEKVKEKKFRIDPTYYNMSFKKDDESVKDYKKAISKKGAYYSVWHHQYITKL